MNAISLCSGCGGLDRGAIDAGINVIRAYEYDATACAAYERFTGHPIEQTDLSCIDLSTIPDADGVFGGLPCQPYSRAGLRKRDTDARDLFGWFFGRYLPVKQPRWFLLENVPDVLPHLGAFLENVEYKVTWRVLDAAGYGVPQNRQRVFIAGVRNDVHGRWIFPNATHTENGDMLAKRWVSMRDALTDWLPTAPKGYIPRWVSSRIDVGAMGDILISNTLGQQSKLPCIRSLDKPSFAVTVSSGARRRIIANGETYLVDNRAAAIFQCLPAWIDNARLIGNAVPPPLAHAVFSGLKGIEDRRMAQGDSQ